VITPNQEPLQTSAVDPAQLEEGAQELRRRKSIRLAQVREQLGTEPGRKWIWDEIVAHGIFEDISGPIEVVYQALGRRREGLRLYLEVNRHPELALQMQREAMARERDERRGRSARRKARTAAP
jgi:hypothetical protein